MVFFCVFACSLLLSLFFCSILHVVGFPLCFPHVRTAQWTLGKKRGETKRLVSRFSIYIAVFFFSKLSLDEFTSPLLRLSHICDSKKKWKEGITKRNKKRDRLFFLFFSLLGFVFCVSAQTNKQRRARWKQKQRVLFTVFSVLLFLSTFILLFLLLFLYFPSLRIESFFHESNWCARQRERERKKEVGSCDVDLVAGRRWRLKRNEGSDYFCPKTTTKKARRFDHDSTKYPRNPSTTKATAPLINPLSPSDWWGWQWHFFCFQQHFSRAFLPCFSLPVRFDI